MAAQSNVLRSILMCSLDKSGQRSIIDVMDHIDARITKWENGGIEAHYLLVFPSIRQLVLRVLLHIDSIWTLLALCQMYMTGFP